MLQILLLLLGRPSNGSLDQGFECSLAVGERGTNKIFAVVVAAVAGKDVVDSDGVGVVVVEM